LWNRIHEHFHVRLAPDGTAYGFDTVDPLLWYETRYLLNGPSHARAIQLLDEFLKTGGERLVRDPLKRAVFQHDLWAIFDWLASSWESRGIPEKAARTALMQRVARAIRRVALTKSQIEALPDTYAAAVASGTFVDRGDRSPQGLLLPRDLFDASGPWNRSRRNPAGHAANTQASSAAPRSSFCGACPVDPPTRPRIS
jgi:hypothetical protein